MDPLSAKRKNMSTSDWIQSVSLLIVVVTLAFSAYQLRLAATQTKAVVRTLHQTIDAANIAFQTQLQDLYLLRDPALLADHLRARGIEGVSHELNKRRLYAVTKMIAHEKAYLYISEGSPTAAQYESWELLLRADLIALAISEIWPAVRKYYSTSFARHVDELLDEIAAEGA